MKVNKKSVVFEGTREEIYDAIMREIKIYNLKYPKF